MSEPSSRPGKGQDDEAPEPKRWRNPFRSEQDAFRLLVLIGLAVAAIVIAAKLGGAWLGVPVALLMLGLGTRATFLWLKVAVEERDPETHPGPG